MVLAFWLMMAVVLPQEDDLSSIQELMRQSNYFEAERALLALQPDDQNYAEIGVHLAQLAFRIGNPDDKRAYYQTYLTRSPEWRATALVVLSAIAVHQKQWDDFEINAINLFNEYGSPPGETSFRMLYHLARHTAIHPEDLNLNNAEKIWFNACLTTPPDINFPASDDPDLPFLLRYAHLLEQKEGDIQDPPSDGGPEAEQFLTLLQLRRALNNNDRPTASSLLNRAYKRDKELNRAELTIHFLPLFEAYLRQADKAGQADTVANNLQTYLSWTVMPLRADAPRIREMVVKRTEKPKPKPKPEPTPEVTEEVKPKPEPEPTGPLKFEEIERRLVRGDKGMELAIRGKSADTTYKRIYRHYLLGYHYLRVARLTPAYEQLQLAQRLIADFPFPNLEVKILSTLAEYYQARGEAERAEWHRVSAAKIWDAIENLPALAAADVPAVSPYRILLDRSLARSNQGNDVHKILYYSEIEHFTKLRMRAYQRQTLSRNQIIGNQLQQIGGRLAEFIDGLAENPRHNGNPRQYNSTLELWNQLWVQVDPYYRNTAFPSVEDIQQSLNQQDRVLSFVEGRSRLGVIVISKTQAFAVGLGSVNAFHDMSADQRFNFLEGRLGPIWKGQGPLMLKLTDSFQDAFLNELRGRMSGSKRLRLVFSLKSLLTTKNASICRTTAVYSDRDNPELEALTRRMPQAGLSMFSSTTTPDAMTSNLEDYDQFILAGNFELTQNGLEYLLPNNRFPIHQLARRNGGLCKLTLISEDFQQWTAAMNELELISPGASTTIYILQKPEQYDAMNQRFGLYFP